MSTQQEEQQRRGPLAGIKVLDFSRILSGPYASMVLADLGAEVVKVEPVGSGDETRNFPPFKGPLSHYFIALNRSKKSITLDLKSPEGAKIARDLARKCDVVLENFRPGVMDRLGLGYETLKADNPGLVYCSITGFGRNSPHGDKPAFDIVAQALSGVMDVNREPGQPPNKLGIPLGDMAGSIFSLFGLLAALVERNTTGQGRHVEIAMLDSLIAMQGYLSQIYFVSGNSPQPVGTRHPSIVPYGAFPTRDGHVIVACLTERFWHNFARCLGREDLITDPRFAEYEKRLENRDALEPEICEIMEKDTTEYWLDRLSEFDVPNAPILSIAESLEQEHVAARGLIETVTHPDVGDMQLVRGPIRFDGEGPAPARAPALLGEHTRSVLSDWLGYDEEEARALETRAAAPGAG
ncbi:CaiB/BaiF CoA transferase family protein [Phaeobacter gallaeciensis]|uniref:CaiB/BaiF CoA transferase family protein n=1 Tax=Phaeobacter gallaeciensis TaxID=60890 RepID=UPI00237FADE2|nr:CoA transferase [Phaeobacter gallaeciensis]MDE4098587.1 CoA transferase [Phaeobacter gallaeciensis]MDE4107397.1 CoA transferase [Phaeobacter gallaeciensis]MDE4111651.1 CoA transferase [Phaeobacter gallaeciensis]MDE4116322.1 CoA transferase [Phaeobacter gallaeciensis]MDE4120793.1 CoA transferase [Phaeobacter gallaeciensis]